MGEIITGEDLLRDILWADEEDYKVVLETINGQSRWAVEVTTVFQRVSDGKLFITNWRKAATENQEHEYPDIAREAEEYEVVVKKYRVKS